MYIQRLFLITLVSYRVCGVVHTCRLLDKMSYYGIYGVNGVANDLLLSYLTQRQQIVDFDGFLSKSLEIQTGVPQGSVLEPFVE